MSNEAVLRSRGNPTIVLALEKIPRATIEEAVLAASSLVALTGVGTREASPALKAMAERRLAGEERGA